MTVPMSIEQAIDTVIDDGSTSDSLNEALQFLYVSMREEQNRENLYLRSRFDDLISRFIDLDGERLSVFLKFLANVFAEESNITFYIDRSEFQAKLWLLVEKDQFQQLSLFVLQNVIFNSPDEVIPGLITAAQFQLLLKTCLESSSSELFMTLTNVMESVVGSIDENSIGLTQFCQYSKIVSSKVFDDDDDDLETCCSLIVGLSRKTQGLMANDFDSTELLDLLVAILTKISSKELFSLVGSISAETKCDLRRRVTPVSNNEGFVLAANLIIMGNTIRSDASKAFFTDDAEFIRDQWRSFVKSTKVGEDFELILLQALFFFKKVCDSTFDSFLVEMEWNNFIDLTEKYLHHSVITYFEPISLIYAEFFERFILASNSVANQMINDDSRFRIYEIITQAVEGHPEKFKLRYNLESSILEFLFKLLTNKVEIISDANLHRLIEVSLKPVYTEISATSASPQAAAQPTVPFKYIFQKSKVFGAVACSKSLIESIGAHKFNNSLVELKSYLDQLKAENSAEDQSIAALANNLKFMASAVLQNSDDHELISTANILVGA